MNDKMLDALLPNKRIITKTAIMNEYSYYGLSNDIDEIEDYLDLFELLKSATPNDVVKLYINSRGGSVVTGYAIIDHIVEAQANGVIVVANIGKECSSMATVIAMYCSDIEVTPRSNMLIHSGTDGHFGAPNENFSSVMFSFEEHKKEMHSDYEGFLSFEEIDNVINNAAPLLLNADQIVERWEKKVAYFGEEPAEQTINLKDLIKETLLEIEADKEVKVPVKRTRAKKAE